MAPRRPIASSARSAASPPPGSAPPRTASSSAAPRRRSTRSTTSSGAVGGSRRLLRLGREEVEQGLPAAFGVDAVAEALAADGPLDAGVNEVDTGVVPFGHERDLDPARVRRIGVVREIA